MPERVLCVDDDPSILAGYQRALRRTADITIAKGGEEGLRALMGDTVFAVVISDMNMPGMTGIQFLAKAKEVAPDTVRMVLTGATDLAVAVNAVNEGHVFRFLTKPCPAEDLGRAIEMGVRQYHLITAERTLMEKTLAGCIGVLTDLLSLVDGYSFERIEAIRGEIRALARQLCIPDVWEVEVAAMLSQIGRLTIPPVISLKEYAGLAMSDVEQDMVKRIPEVGSMLLANIPRLEAVGRMVLYVNKRFDGSGFPADSTTGELIPLGARVIRLVFDLAQLERGGLERAAALAKLAERAGAYDPKVLAAANACLQTRATQVRGAAPVIRPMMALGLKPGHILRSDIVTQDGQRLVAAGHCVTAALLERVTNFARITTIIEPIQVEIPPQA
jgi:response regulator RpfG family c-di-GMP phosphodiesterase